MKKITKKIIEKANRDLLVINFQTEYGNPAVYFDANNGQEWTKMIGLKSNEKIRFLEEEGWVHMSKIKDDDDRNRKFKEPKRH